MPTQVEKAEQLLKWHAKGATLLLPNAWDVASARVFEEAGFPAIATTSAGVAFAYGYADGELISRELMLEAVRRIVQAVKVPVTADVEAGYGPSPEDVAETVRGVIAAGAVGVNLEDNQGSGQPLYPIEAQAARLKAGREAAQAAGIPIVINARVDTYLYQIGAAEGRLDDAIQRGKAYMEAGATSIFVPGVVDPAVIEILVRAIPAPINILAGPGAPSAPELFRLGVTRISVGGAIMRATMGLTRDIARQLRDQGTYELLGLYPYSHGDASGLFSR
jgi:2-methylisocitrate lyase-like PEP mutase family enzyme